MKTNFEYRHCQVHHQARILTRQGQGQLNLELKNKVDLAIIHFSK